MPGEGLVTSREAERALFQDYHQRIYRLVYRMVSCPEDARDLTQDIFLKAFEHLDSFRGEGEVFTWLYRMAVNRCIDYRRKRKRRIWRFFDTQEEREPPESLREPAETPEESLLLSERRQQIQQALSRLKPEFQAVVVLKEIEGLGYREIADILGCSVGTVGSRLSRARRELAKHLRHYLL